MQYGVTDVLDSYGGMISRKQAQELSAGAGARSERDVTNVSAFLEYVNAKSDNRLVRENAESAYTVNIQDRIYRIFNPMEYGKQKRRTIVLGSEGATIRMVLRGKLVDFIDSNVFERGDIVLIRNAAYDPQRNWLTGIYNTMINKIMPSPLQPITDFSQLHEGMKNIDILGKITEIGPIRYVNRLTGEGRIAVSDCMLSDLEKSISASLWGSSALMTSKLTVNDYVKIEFCNVVSRNSNMELYANDLSRIVSSKIFAGRLRPALH